MHWSLIDTPKKGIISSFGNLLLAASMAVCFTAAFLLWRWMRSEDLDPKFKIILALLVLQVVLMVRGGAV